MNKSTFFTGQPIFSQIIKMLTGCPIGKLSEPYQGDRYCKKFRTYEHLVTMLYTIFNRCTSIREVTTGLMACETKLNHLGMKYSVRRSTLSDANMRRDSKIFESIYTWLYRRYHKILPDSQSKKWRSRLYIMDSTTITLFQEILKGSGIRSLDGKRKGGIKAHTLMKADEDIPQLVTFTASACADTAFMKQINLPKGSILTFDKGYNNYERLSEWDSAGVSWVSRLRKAAIVELLQKRPLSENQLSQGVVSDQWAILGHNHHKTTKLKVRLITYFDKEGNRQFQFLTNNTTLSALSISQIYKQRWQIEILFKRIKQNYPLRNFLGDTENAIRIQIWCALIADLLLKVIQKQVKRPWGFINLASMIRLHLMTYINLWQFLNQPEKALIQSKYVPPPSLFPT
jgi:hypothetical protein